MKSRILWTVLLATSCAAAQGQDSGATAADATAIRTKAYEAEGRGDHATAAEAFLELTKLEATNPSWFERAGENLGRAGRFNDAMDLLDGAIAKFPDVPELSVMLAQTYHLKADSMVAEGIFDVNVTFYYEDAARTAKRVLDIKSDHLRAQLLYASARFQLSDFDNALAMSAKAAEANPNDYGAQAMLGKVTHQMFVNLKQAYDRDKPKGTAGQARLAAIDVARARAIDALTAASKASPDRSYPVVRLADIHAWSGNMPDALTVYGNAMAIDPAAKLDHGWLRSATSAEQRVTLYEGALARYQKRSDANAAQAAVLQWHGGIAHWDARAYEKARPLFIAAHKGRPDFVATHYYLMQTAYWSGDEKGAVKAAIEFARVAPSKFGDMIRKDEQTMAVLRGMAQRSYQGGRLVESRELNHVIAYAANTTDEWNNYAFLCRETGKFKDSYGAYERAIELEESPQLLNDAAVILQYHLATDENLATAREYYERAIELANEMLGDDSLDAKVRARTQTALRDARSNLRRLR